MARHFGTLIAARQPMTMEPMPTARSGHRRRPGPPPSPTASSRRKAWEDGTGNLGAVDDMAATERTKALITSGAPNPSCYARRADGLSARPDQNHAARDATEAVATA